MKLVPINSLFHIARGTNLDLNALVQVPDGIPYVSCTAGNNGVLARVSSVDGVEPSPSGVLSVALVGSAMATFIQDEPFYSAQNIAVLTPLTPMSRGAMLYYAACLRANQFRFSYGRKANRTMKSLMVPAATELPLWVDSTLPAETERFNEALESQKSVGPTSKAKLQAAGKSTQDLICVNELFEVRPGTSLELNALTQREGGVPFVARSAKNNGVTAQVAPPAGVEALPSGVLSVALGGTPMSTFLQEEPFYCGFHVSYLVPRTPMSRAVLLYYAACLRANRYRFSYGRQANRSLATLKIPALNAVPSWVEKSIPDAVCRLQVRLPS